VVLPAASVTVPVKVPTAWSVPFLHDDLLHVEGSGHGAGGVGQGAGDRCRGRVDGNRLRGGRADQTDRQEKRRGQADQRGHDFLEH
jgi:hypothetical protein